MAGLVAGLGAERVLGVDTGAVTDPVALVGRVRDWDADALRHPRSTRSAPATSS